MEKALPKNLFFRKNPEPAAVNKSLFVYNEGLIKSQILVSFKARVLAIVIFLYHFIENGTLGLLPQKMYVIHRSVRLSDIILYALVIYSLTCYKEYKELFKSKSFLIVKILLSYYLISFMISYFRYEFNPIEYFFRLKGLWSSFLILPYMLLIKRNGLSFFIKIIFPVAIVSNVLYILSALTGIAFLPDVSIIKQRLPGDIEVYRVYSGTFFGEIFFLGFVYYWITKKFRIYQLLLSVLFVIPHILAFGRSAWAFFTFAILMMVLLNSLRKKNFKLLIRQAIILGILGITVIVLFIKFIPESDYYIEALQARLFQGQEDVKYGEGTYGARVLFQNNALFKLWQSTNPIVGIGIHPMWVYRPESFEEQVYYNAFSDVVWPSVLAAYGLLGFTFSVIFQLFFIITGFRLIKKVKETNVITMVITLAFSKMIFDTFINFSYVLFSVGLWGFFGSISFYVACLVFIYEKIRTEKADEGKQVNNSELVPKSLRARLYSG